MCCISVIGLPSSQSVYSDYALLPSEPRTLKFPRQSQRPHSRKPNFANLASPVFKLLVLPPLLEVPQRPLSTPPAKKTLISFDIHESIAIQQVVNKRKEREKWSKNFKKQNPCRRICKFCNVHLPTEENYQETPSLAITSTNKLAKAVEYKTCLISLYALSYYQRHLQSILHRLTQSFRHYILLFVALSSL